MARSDHQREAADGPEASEATHRGACSERRSERLERGAATSAVDTRGSAPRRCSREGLARKAHAADLGEAIPNIVPETMPFPGHSSQLAVNVTQAHGIAVVTCGAWALVTCRNAKVRRCGEVGVPGLQRVPSEETSRYSWVRSISQCEQDHRARRDLGYLNGTHVCLLLIAS